jgi:dihydrofolate reductase
MRRIHMFNRVSADGYFATPDGGLDWVIQEPTMEAEIGGGIAGEGAMLFGRKTYDGFESFWPNAIKQGKTAPSPHGEKRESEALYQMGVHIHNAVKIVFSRTRKDVTWHNSRLIRDFDPAFVAELKAQPGGDIMIFGSGSIVSLLTRHGLIDDYTFVVSPILLGSGRSIFTGGESQRALTLVEAKSYPRGNVVLRYRKA